MLKFQPGTLNNFPGLNGLDESRLASKLAAKFAIAVTIFAIEALAVALAA